MWVLLKELQEDEALAVTDITMDARGQPPPKCLKRATVQHQRRLQQLCAARRDKSKTVPDVLKALGHAIRLNIE